MKISKVTNNNFFNIDPVVKRLNVIRKGLRMHGMVVVDLENKVDVEAINRLRKVHGSDNVKIEQSSNAKLTIRNFK